MSGDHPGYPETPGLKAAVARMTAAIDHGERRDRLEAERRSTARADHRLGEAVRRLPEDRSGKLARDFPELASAIRAS
jgi:hypothetical protein